jgi:bacteriophage lambda tail assembly protein I
LEQGLNKNLKENATVHFTPVLKGSKKAGLFQTIVGAVMVVVGAVFQQYYLVGAGIGLMAGGVAQMLTKMPSMKSGKEAEKKQSTSFSNLSNMAAQGRPVPLAYGRIRVGSLIISQGIETMDVDREPTLADRGNKIGGDGSGNSGNNGIIDKNRYRDKSGRIYPWLEAWES